MGVWPGCAAGGPVGSVGSTWWLPNSGRQLPTSEAPARLLIRADARVAHQAVVTALDVAGQQGFTDIVIETTPAETP